MRGRAYRRSKKLSKWVRKLKLMWQEHCLGPVCCKVKESKHRYTLAEINSMPKIESWKDLTEDRNGVRLKNTGCIWSDPSKSIQDIHKERVEGKCIPQDQLDEYFDEKDSN